MLICTNSIRSLADRAAIPVDILQIYTPTHPSLLVYSVTLQGKTLTLQQRCNNVEHCVTRGCSD